MKLINAKQGEKKDQLERLIAMGTVMIFVDTRKMGVDVPANHKGSPQLALNLSYNFPIPDFKILIDRVEATLTFPEGKHLCILPYLAIYGMTSRFAGETVVFPEDIPPEFLQQQVQQVKGPTPVLVPPPPPDPPPQNSSPLDDPSKKKKGGHLRLIK